MSFPYSDKWLTHPPYKPYSYNFTLYRLPHNAWKKDGKNPHHKLRLKQWEEGEQLCTLEEPNVQLKSLSLNK